MSMTKLTRGMAALRRAGFIVRRRFKCCQACAIAALAHEAKAMNAAARARAIGYVFYTKQDDERRAGTLRDLAIRKRPAVLWLSFGALEGFPLSTVQVGTLARALLLEAGLDVRWNGDPSVRLSIHPDA